MKLVYVEWLDSETDQGWRVVDRYNQREVNLTCITVGWLVTETEDFISVAGSRSIDPNDSTHAVCDPITIPQVSIIKYHEIVFE